MSKTTRNLTADIQENDSKPNMINAETIQELIGQWGVSAEDSDPVFVINDSDEDEPPEEIIVEETQKTSPSSSSEKESDNKEEPKAPYAEVDLQNAVLHLIKPKAKWRKEYIIAKGFSVWLSPTNDRQDKELNELTLKELSTGDKRLRTDVVESYTDPVTNKYIAGGRTETEYFYNPDAGRALRRAETASYIQIISDIDVSTMKLTDKVNILEEYSPFILEAIYEKAIYPFVGLLEEAKKEILNF